VDNHALAVDVVYLQPGNFGAAHARAVENHQQCALKQAAAGIDQTSHFLQAQNVGQLPLHLGIGQELAKLMAMKRAYEEEPQRGHVVLDCSRIQLPHLEQIRLIAAKMIRAELVR